MSYSKVYFWHFYAITGLALFLILPEAFSQKVSMGIGGVYADGAKEYGINLNAHYHSKNEKLFIGPEFFYFPTVTEQKDMILETRDIWELNINANWVFDIGKHHQIEIYPFSGFNITKERIEEKINGTSDIFKKTKAGLNLGFGFHYHFKYIAPFFEFDHLFFSPFEQNTITIGILYFNHKRHKKHKNEVD